jgi:hypothetical protein
VPVKALAEAWESYRRLLPPDTSPTQLEETQRAFYAGAQTCLTALVNTSVDELQSECSDYIDDFAQRHGTHGAPS